MSFHVEPTENPWEVDLKGLWTVGSALSFISFSSPKVSSNLDNSGHGMNSIRPAVNGQSPAPPKKL